LPHRYLNLQKEMKNNIYGKFLYKLIRFSPNFKSIKSFLLNV
jgi:hypothetical protein